MHEEPPTPFDTVGDEPVEARIVAWVLGESSAFEAAELERLCEERPELLVFRRRMRALHGLLTEAEAAEPDHSWKLPAEKRKLLDEIFGEETDVRLGASEELHIRRYGRRAMLAIAACVAITFFVARLAPWKYEAEATLEVKPRSLGMSSSNPFTPQFFGTEFEKIKSRNSLEKVVDNLELAQRWNMDKESAIKRVRDSIETRNVAGTDLLSIKVRDASERDAQEVTQEVVRAYQKYRSDLEQKEVEKSLFELKKAVRDQEDKVEERRKVLATIVRTKGIIYKGQDSFYGASGVDEDQGARSAGEVAKNDTREEAIKRGLDAQDYVDAKREFETDQQLLQAMKLKQINERITRQMTDESIVVHEMTPPVESKQAKAKPSSSAASVGKAEVAQQLNQPKAGIDVAGGSNFAPRDDRSEVAKSKQSLPAARGMIVDREEKIEEERDVAASSVRAKASDETLARNESSSQFFDKDVQQLRTAPGQQPAPAAAPAAPTSVAGMGISPALKANARQLQPAKQPATTAPTLLLGAEVAQTLPALDEPSEIPALPEITTGSGIGGGAGSGDARPRVVPPAPEDEFAQRLEKDSTPAAGERSTFAGTSVDGIPADPNQFAWNGVTSGLRSGDQAINRNSIDAILNNPNRVADGATKAKEIKAESDATPPVLADLEASATAEPARQPAAVGGALTTWGSTRPELAGAGGKSEADAPLDDGSTKFADGATKQDMRELTFEHAQAVDKVRRNLYTAEGNYNLGKFDDAKKSYQETLKIDPYNSAARRGLEQVEVAKSDHYRASYDHTRAELLGQVDSAWELKVPADGKIQEFEGWVDNGAPVADGESQHLLLGVELDNQGELSKEMDSYVETSEADLDFGKLAQRELESSRIAPAKPAPQKLVDLMEEIPAAENPYSTFSLNISDASFQLAKAALAKGERPDPDSIKPEQFYNAVDYGDPAPSSNEPVAATIEQSAHPIIPGRNLVRVALRTGSAGRSAAQPLRLTLLVDQSGSMVREDRRASMEHALAQLSGLLTKADLVTVIGFSRIPHLLAEAKSGDEAGKLGDLVNQTASEGGTNLEEAMKLGADKAVSQQLAGAQNRIVLFTDGAANLGDANPERLAEQVKALRQKGIAFDIAGIGADGLNDRLLSELARNGNGRYYVVGSENNDSFARQLAGAFRPAAENVKVQVNFNPQRVGKYKLIGFEKDRLKTEDFRNDAVDAAELAAEEAGVAIYQVEPLAEGTGELGEVSVRFRDAASGQMVERAWTIPYAAQATAFDRATPSMQLAGLSLLAAEKLKGGPLADAIDFKQLTGPAAFVKQFYGSSSRVSEMLRVIDALK